jgi:hypothetical protein
VRRFADQETAGIEHPRPSAVIGVEALILGYGRGDRRGIPGNYYRMSIGIEDPDDIAADLNQALERG